MWDERCIPTRERNPIESDAKMRDSNVGHSIIHRGKKSTNKKIKNKSGMKAMWDVPQSARKWDPKMVRQKCGTFEDGCSTMEPNPIKWDPQRRY
jgi:hypothetical protein